MFVGCFALLIIMIWAFRETPSGKALHLYAVEIPAQKIENIATGQLLFLMIALILMPSLATVFSMDLAVIAAWDFALYYEVAITTWTIASVMKTKAALKHMKSRLFILVRRQHPSQAQSRRAKHTRKLIQPSNDDDDGHAIRLIAA